MVLERREVGVLPFLLGTAVGALLGVLFAPRSGEETRRVIGDRVRTWKDQAEETFEDAVAEARRQAEAGLSAARRAVEEQAGEVREVFEAGRSAARETREELRRRRGASRKAASGSEPGEPEGAGA